MGRLPALVAAVVAALSGCSEDKRPTPSAPTARREAVTASGPVAVAPTPKPTPSAKPPPTPRTLCAGAALDRPTSSEKVGHAQAPGAPVLGSTIPVGNGKWSWINLWAAWCGPCKEEMPRLFQWQSKLAAHASFHFVSLDDDERQLLKFLQDQPAGGLRTSFWLPEGKTREKWLSGMKLDASPELPIQILVNPQGRVHCVIQGAVEDSDFQRVSAIVSQR